MTIIRDPDTTQGQHVNDKGQSEVAAIVEDFSRFQAHRKGLTWSYTIEDINPVGAADKFIYIENTSSDTEYAITKFRMFASTTAGIIRVKRVSGTPAYVSATAVAPVGRNSNFNTSPSLIFNTDTDITNLTDEGTDYHIVCTTVDTLYTLQSDSGVILAPGGKVALEWEPATGEISGVLTVVRLDKITGT